MTHRDLTTTHVDIRTLTDDELDKVNRFANLIRAEAKPDDRPAPLEVMIAGVRNIPTFVEPHAWNVTTSDGDIVAAASAAVAHTGENDHLLQCAIQVHPTWRRQGLGTTLLGELIALAEATERRLLIGTTTATVPAGAAFCRRVGAVAAQVNRTSELDLRTLDRDLVQRWLADGPRRAQDYELVLFEGPYPRAEYPALIDCIDVMNTAPRGELQVEDRHTTPEQLAATDQALAAQGVERRAAFVRHVPSGIYAGFSDIYWHPANPGIVRQGSTGVRPDHRGHAVGKWVKAALLHRILEERPEALLVRTSNAYTNDAMLGINTELGFVEKHAETTWQLDVQVGAGFCAADEVKPSGQSPHPGTI